MTPQQIEAMKLALEALHKGKVACEWGQAHDHVQQIVQAMESIKEALAQPEQEPVAWLSTDSIGERHLCFDKPLDNDPVQPLFTSPPQRTWVGLTEQDLDYLCNLAYTGDEEFALAVQAKLMEKNA
jgi:hypothetical protein